MSSARWLAPILSVMSGEPGSRFGALAQRLPISRSILSASLDMLERFGWVARNAGHGHPLRPEYLLTAEGRKIAAWCAQLMSQRRRLGLDPQVFRRWSLPLIGELIRVPASFSTLQRALEPISPRALSLTIHDLRQGQLVRHLPEDALYDLTGQGRRFAEPLLSIR